jgi:hypothetical protein
MVGEIISASHWMIGVPLSLREMRVIYIYLVASKQVSIDKNGEWKNLTETEFADDTFMTRHFEFSRRNIGKKSTPQNTTSIRSIAIYRAVQDNSNEVSTSISLGALGDHGIETIEQVLGLEIVTSKVETGLIGPDYISIIRVVLTQMHVSLSTSRCIYPSIHPCIQFDS